MVSQFFNRLKTKQNDSNIDIEMPVAVTYSKPYSIGASDITDVIDEIILKAEVRGDFLIKLITNNIINTIVNNAVIKGAKFA